MIPEIFGALLDAPMVGGQVLANRLRSLRSAALQVKNITWYNFKYSNRLQRQDGAYLLSTYSRGQTMQVGREGEVDGTGSPDELAFLFASSLRLMSGRDTYLRRWVRNLLSDELQRDTYLRRANPGLLPTGFRSGALVEINARQRN